MSPLPMCHWKTLTPANQTMKTEDILILILLLVCPFFKGLKDCLVGEALSNEHHVAVWQTNQGPCQIFLRLKIGFFQRNSNSFPPFPACSGHRPKPWPQDRGSLCLSFLHWDCPALWPGSCCPHDIPILLAGFPPHRTLI